MDPRIVIRIGFVALSTYAGYHLGAPNKLSAALVGLVASLLFVLLERGADILPAKHLVLAAVGLAFGLLLALLVAHTIPDSLRYADKAQIICSLAFGYLGVMFAVKNADRIDLSSLSFVSRSNGGSIAIPDTSVIVSGRIKDLIEAHFIRGHLVIASFVLRELQALADSGEARKRTMGRRGLDVLDEIKTMDARLTVYEQEYENIPSVDLKLIELAKDINGEIITEDYNLYKIALLRQTRALNINELAAALRPPAHIGESVTIHIAKEGTEPGQGVGYLDDGTMVVVDNAANRLREDVSCEITQVRQTPTGRMLFAEADPGRQKTKYATSAGGGSSRGS